MNSSSSSNPIIVYGSYPTSMDILPLLKVVNPLVIKPEIKRFMGGICACMGERHHRKEACVINNDREQIS